MARPFLFCSANFACALAGRELSGYSRSGFPLRPRDSELRVVHARAILLTCCSDHPVSAQSFSMVSQVSGIAVPPEDARGNHRFEELAQSVEVGQARAVAAQTRPRLPERFVDCDDVPGIQIPDRDESDDKRAVRKESRNSAVLARLIRERRVASTLKEFEPAKNLPLRNMGLTGAKASEFGERKNFRARWQEQFR